MGLFYNKMIEEIKSELPGDKYKIELFLKNKEEKYKEIYQLPDSLFYLNIFKLLEEVDVTSDYFKTKKDEANEDVF